MNKPTYRSYNELPLTLSALNVAAVLGISWAGASASWSTAKAGFPPSTLVAASSSQSTSSWHGSTEALPKRDSFLTPPVICFVTWKGGKI